MTVGGSGGGGGGRQIKTNIWKVNVIKGQGEEEGGGFTGEKWADDGSSC